MSRQVEIHRAHPRLRFDRRAVEQVIHVLDAHAARFQGGPPDGVLSVAFLTDRALAELHGRFLDDPTTTDVITFEAAPGLGSAGEICVSADTARTFARERKLDFSRELTLYVVHGWLHLAGYDDLQPAKKRRMRAAEARAMRLLDAAAAVPKFQLR